MGQDCRMGRTMLNAVVNHFYIVAKIRSMRVKRFVKDGMTLSLPFRICPHKDFHARHGRPPSGGEAAPCPELDPRRRDTLTGHDERLDTHLRPPYPL